MLTEEDVRRIVREEVASIEAERIAALNREFPPAGITFKAKSPEEAEAVLTEIRKTI